MNFEQDIHIDKLSLDDELLAQPEMLYRYDEALNEEKETLARMELSLSVIEADVATRVRQGTYPDSVGKVTESVVKEIIDQDESVVERRSAIIEQKRVVARYASASEAFRQRKSMLQKLVDLYIYEYYNTVRPDGSRPNMSGGKRVEDTQIEGLASRRRRRAAEADYDDTQNEGE